MGAWPAAVERMRDWRNAYLVLNMLLLMWAAAATGLDRYGHRAAPAGGYDAIVVAGCRVGPGGRPSRALRARAEGGVALWKAGVAPVLVFTGGVGQFPPSEAEAAASVARAAGVPPRAIVLEDRSTTTAENAAFAARRTGARRGVVVSDAYHVFRAQRIFGQHFDEAWGYGVRGPASARIKGALREVLAVAWHGARGAL